MANFKETVQQYFDLKAKEKELKAEIDFAGGEIKKYLTENKLEEFDADGVKVTYKGSERSSINEEKLIKTIKKIANNTDDKEVKKVIKSCIKKVETIDEPTLETLIYNNVIDSSDLECCYESKMIYTLRVQKAKK